jgi:TolB-like protein/Tfp pilus assembly protein PilF
MSPEQAMGREVDHRSDIFSLGVALYEMITGHKPFEGATPSETIAAILRDEPPPLTAYLPDVPGELARIVSKALRKDREERYQSAKELIAELKMLSSGSQAGEKAAKRKIEAVVARFALRRWTVVAAIAVVLIVGLVSFLYWRRPRTVQPDQIKSLAVLPLENLSGDPAQEYFADGMTEALISNLTQVRALRVISRTSVMRFKDSRKPLAEIARELNVDAVIEGSVRRDGGRVKITARLIRAVDESPLRSFDYERDLADVLRLQSEVARAVTNEIRAQVTAEERARMASARRINPEAHEAYLLGRYHLRRQNETELKLAIDHFERAIQLDADYAAAWAGLSIAWLQRGFFGATSFREVEQPAREATLKALAADAGSAEGYTALAMLKHRYEWDWAGAEHDFRRAIDLNPGSVDAHRFFAFLLSALGRHNEAISEIQTAEQLDPLSSGVQADLGIGLFRARKYEQAERRYKRAIDLDPRNWGAWSRLSDLHREMGRYADAIASLEKAEALASGSESTESSRRFPFRFALVYARMGRQKEARQMLKKLQRTTDPARLPVLEAAAVWTALGNKDEAFRLLFDAVGKPADLLIYLKIHPMFDSLHSDPRWKELLRPMNFPE